MVSFQVEKTVILVNDIKEAGRYVVNWNGLNENGMSVSSGVYFYRLQTDNFVQVRKLMILR